MRFRFIARVCDTSFRISLEAEVNPATSSGFRKIHRADDLEAASRRTSRAECFGIRSQWKQYAKPPGFGAHLYAGFIFILPKFGPLSMLAGQSVRLAFTPKICTFTGVNRFYQGHAACFDELFDTIDLYIANRDLDTGQVVKPGAYPL